LTLNPIENLNKAFENRIRLGIMSILMVNDWVDFNSLREWLLLTDGNLSSHVSSLEEAGYVEVKKEFVSKRPKTSYRATLAGREAFQQHLTALEKLIDFNR
jgi:DNA-binding MarR family transcriptional regulator